MALLRFAANPMDAEQGEGGLQILAVTANIGEEPFLARARPRVPLPTLATFAPACARHCERRSRAANASSPKVIQLRGSIAALRSQ
jgi:hypothetical protein